MLILCTFWRLLLGSSLFLYSCLGKCLLYFTQTSTESDPTTNPPWTFQIEAADITRLLLWRHRRCSDWRHTMIEASLFTSPHTNIERQGGVVCTVHPARKCAVCSVQCASWQIESITNSIFLIGDRQPKQRSNVYINEINNDNKAILSRSFHFTFSILRMK